MVSRLMLFAIITMTAINLAVLAVNLSTSSQATVAGMDSFRLQMDYDFKTAVESIVEDCTVDNDSISC